MTKRYPRVSEEYKKAVDEAKRKLKGLIYHERNAPLMLRLAWQSAATYGSMRLLQAEQSAWDKLRLKIAVKALAPLKERFPIISYTDFYQLAGVAAVEVIGGPVIFFHPGRKDKEDPPVKSCLPDETKGGDHLRDVYVNIMGLDDKDAVTLSGGYNLTARSKKRRYGFEGQRYGFEKPDTYSSLVFDNSYFKDLLADEKEGRQPPPTYIALLKDPVFRPLVEKYADVR